MERTLNQYLRLATWGLPHKKKLEIQAELRGNIEILTLEYQVQGFSASESLSLALRDFGTPERVCVGMTKVYTMPILLRNIGLAVLLSSLGLGVLNSSSAQVSATNLFPNEICLTKQADRFKVNGRVFLCQSKWTAYIHLPSLEKTLEKLGVKVRRYSSAWKTTELLFPKAPRSIYIRRYSGPKILEYNNNDAPKAVAEGSFDYIDASDFFQQLSDSGLPITIKGWNYPKIGVGKTEFSLGENAQQLKGSFVIELLTRWSFHNFFGANLEFEPTYILKSDEKLFAVNDNRVQFKIRGGKVGDIYAVLTREEIEDIPQLPPSYAMGGKNMRRVFLQPLGKSLQLETYTRGKTLLPKSNAEQLAPVPVDGTGNVMVVRLTGRLDQFGKVFEIVPAKNIEVLK